MNQQHQRSATPRFTRGFSLIELLVVIAIIGTLAGIIFASGLITHDRIELRVAEAARGVERKLLEARNLAISVGQPHGVVFHIENAGSGIVLRNGDSGDAKSFLGRHWCAIIGPAQASDELPRLTSGGTTAQKLAASTEQSQVGERYYLPRGTRFLALGDAEDNLHNLGSTSIPFTSTAYTISNWSVDTGTRTGVPSAANSTYPRPWFGFLSGSGAAWKLHAWGGYDPLIPGSGLDYECTNRYRSGDPLASTAIINSTNSVVCSCGVETGRPTNTPAENKYTQELMQPCADDSQLGKSRPLLNGYWMDFMIVFLPNGNARCMTLYNRNQLFSFATATTGPALRDIVSGSTSNSRFHGRDDGIIVLEHSVLGGAAITIAKDTKESNNVFPSPEKALASLLPLQRVIVKDATGGVEIIKPFAGIQSWLNAQERNIPLAQRVWTNGWEFCAETDADPNKMRVSGALVVELLTQHDPYPWIKPKP